MQVFSKKNFVMVILNSELWLHKVRDIEIKHAINLLENLSELDKFNNSSILEIGSGDGYVIEKLATQYPNCDFLGLEVEGSFYENKSKRVLQYDGHNLNFLNRKFDIIFSLHVVEHIKDIDKHAKEIKKILKPNGIWINIVPSSTWRLFTSLNYYPAIFFNFFSLLKRYRKLKKESKKKKSKFNKSPFSFFLPQRHGEIGNFLTEYFYFTIYYWSKRFRKLCLNNDMLLIHSSNIPYFYYSRDLFRNLLNDKVRGILAKFFGGSSIILIAMNKSKDS